jgi:hypothetical protein
MDKPQNPAQDMKTGLEGVWRKDVNLFFGGGVIHGL